MKKITIIGLGPGDFSLLTMAAWELMTGGRPLWLRTAKHPTAEEIKRRGIEFHSYDSFYEEYPDFESLYAAIATDQVARAVRGEGPVFAVPGSPSVAEKTVRIIEKMASEQAVDVEILPAVSFLESLYARLGFDPIQGLLIMDSADMGTLNASSATAAVITQVYNRTVASEVKLSLMEFLPDDYEIIFVRNLSMTDEEVRTIQLYELDRQPCLDHLTSIFVPAVKDRAASFSCEPLVEVMARLRSPEGCLWDIEQTHTSLRRYIVEEVYEVLEAIDNTDAEALCEELGDLLLQIVFHARVAEESGAFSMQDVVNTVTEKMLRRHPHVFGEISVRDAAEVVVNWEIIKKQEKSHAGHGVLDGVPKGLPALMRAYKLQAKAAKVGFDWQDIEPVWDKLREEIGELKEALTEQDKAAVENELGDVLFTVVNLARLLKYEPETALNMTNNKFIKRFKYVEQCVAERGSEWAEFSLSELDEFWELAKKI